jgi:hypothetical protein
MRPILPADDFQHRCETEDQALMSVKALPGLAVYGAFGFDHDYPSVWLSTFASFDAGQGDLGAAFFLFLEILDDCNMFNKIGFC